MIPIRKKGHLNIVLYNVSMYELCVPAAVRDALEWRGFHTLGRLSYCVFLIHFIVLRITLASNTQLGHASLLSMVRYLMAQFKSKSFYSET